MPDSWRTIRHAGRPRTEARPSREVEQQFADDAQATWELERDAELAERIRHADRLIVEAIDRVREVAPPGSVGTIRGIDHHVARARSLLRALRENPGG